LCTQLKLVHEDACSPLHQRPRVELVDSYEHTLYNRAFVYRDQMLSGDKVVKTRVMQDHWLRFQDFLDRNDPVAVLGVGKALIFVKSVCKADPGKVVRSAISEVWEYTDETYVPPGWPVKIDKKWARLGGELYSISKGAPLDMEGQKLHAISLETLRRTPRSSR